MLRGSHSCWGGRGQGWGCSPWTERWASGPHGSVPPALSGMEVRWCTTSDQEQQKCSDMSKAFQEAGIQPPVVCTQGTSVDHCIQLIAVSSSPSLHQTGGL